MSSRAEKLNRDARFLQYIRERWTTEDIADREGMQIDFVSKERTRIAKRNPQLKLGSKKRRTRQPAVGINSDSIIFRRRLSFLVDDLRRKFKPAEIAFRVGIPQKHQLWASDDIRADYNWTIGQLHRLATEHGLTFNQLLEKLTAPATAMERARAKPSE